MINADNADRCITKCKLQVYCKLFFVPDILQVHLLSTKQFVDLSLPCEPISDLCKKSIPLQMSLSREYLKSQPRRTVSLASKSSKLPYGLKEIYK